MGIFVEGRESVDDCYCSIIQLNKAVSIEMCVFCGDRAKNQVFSYYFFFREFAFSENYAQNAQFSSIC